MRHLLLFATLVIATLCHLGCSSDEEQPENPNAAEALAELGAPPFIGDVVLENMYEDEVRKLTPKAPLEIVTVLEGTSKVILQARFRRAVASGPYGLPVYECELIDESAETLGGIASGMSGSPVGPPGRVMGALAFATTYAKPPHRFWVTPIDAMEAAIAHPTFAEFLEQPAPAAPAVQVGDTHAPVKTPMMITGVDAHMLQELASHLSGSRFKFVELFANIGGAPAAPPAGTTTKLSAGDMIGAAVVTGDVANVIGFGTVTQIYDNQFVAFGHPFFADGKSALPVYRAVTDGIIARSVISSKSVSAYGNPIGTITKDLLPAIVGELGTVPPMIPVTFSYQPVNSDTLIEKHHAVAYGGEWAIPLVAAVTMDALRLERNPGTIDATVTLHFQETGSVYTESFRSTSSVLFLDVLKNTRSIINSFTDVHTNRAGKATLKEVGISITDKPQIAEAEIEEIIVSDEVMPGESLTVAIVLVPHWSAANAGRTIQRNITLEIPDNFPIGEATLTVSAEASALGTEFEELFGGILDGILEGEEEEDEKPLPKNLNELIEQKQEDQVDAGLIKVTLEASSTIAEDILEDLPLPEGFPEFGNPLEGLPLPDVPPLPDGVEPEKSVEAELIIEGFVVSGSKDKTITIKGEDADDGMILEDEAANQ